MTPNIKKDILNLKDLTQLTKMTQKNHQDIFGVPILRKKLQFYTLSKDFNNSKTIIIYCLLRGILVMNFTK